MTDGEHMYCCVDCFADEEIKAFVTSFNNLGNCAYCQSTGVHVAKVSDLRSFIVNGLERVYDARHGDGWLREAKGVKSAFSG